MSDVTTNYGLEKPLGSENYDIQVQNRNMDKVDIKLKGNADAIVTNAEALALHSADYTRSPGYAVDTGVANAYVVTLNPAPTAYVDGMMISVKINIVNTTVPTINVNGLGIKQIHKGDGSPLNSSDLLPYKTYLLVYDTVYGVFMLIGGDTDATKLGGVAASGYATAAQGTKADNAIPLSQKGAVGGVASYDAVATSLADNTQEHLDIVAQIEGISLIDSAVAITDANSLFTATKLDGALNELFTFANDGKIAVANAITAKGVTASSADTFPTLATKVGQIQSVLTGNMTAGDLLTGHTGYANNPLGKISGTMVDRGTVNITPSTVNQAILGGNHSGLGIVSGDSDLNGNNILKNKNIFGVVGNVIDKKVSRQTFALYVANELKYQSIYLPFKPKYWRFNVSLSPSPTTLTAKSYFLEAGENIDYIFDANTSIYKEVYASKNDIFTGSDNSIDVVVDIWDLWTDQGDGTWFNSFRFNANVIDTLYITFIAYSDI